MRIYIHCPIKLIMSSKFILFILNKIIELKLFKKKRKVLTPMNKYIKENYDYFKIFT